ncbi:MAG: hypothetical protein PHW32_01675 [Bacilli bacterium]|nr:hypothetical protein [Bacilli bacterium]MDD4719041.1 hypothetical protein [Bacilli bacterium]
MCGIIGYIGKKNIKKNDISNFICANSNKVGKITIVHNGSIENYEVLRDILKQSGYKFNSNTDTEVVCALIDKLYSEKNNLVHVLEQCYNLLRGDYALSIKCDDDLKTIYAITNTNPLIVGIGDNENYVAYDVSDVIKHTNRYVLIESNEIAKIKSNQVTVYNRKDNIVYKEVQTIN